MDINSLEFANCLHSAMVEIVRQEINSTGSDIRYSGIIVAPSGGFASITLASDTLGTQVVVQNPNEIPLEIGDQVFIVAINGDLSNAFIECRKGITLDNIYVDYSTGVDAYGINSSGIQYGTTTAPFKTLQYAVNRLPKNLNGRIINIYHSNSDSAETLYINNFFGGGQLYILPKVASTYDSIGFISIEACNNIYLYISYLNSSTGIGTKYSSYIVFNYCNVTTSDAFNYGYSIEYGSNCSINNSTISNRYGGIWAGYGSQVYSADNSGTSNQTGLLSYYNSTIGKTGTQPAGTTAEATSGGSIIR